MRIPIQERLHRSRPLLMDGATGTELSRRGVDLNSPSWTAGVLLDHPELLGQIHRDYVDAGAEMVTANTFRTHARNLKSIGQEHAAEQLTARAVEIARSVCGPDVYIAGSIAPLEDCYSPQLTPSFEELSQEHRQMAGFLKNAAVDFLLIETQLTIREARIAAQAAQSTGIPFGVSFVCNGRGQLLSGESLTDAYRAVAEFEPVAFLVNCVPVEEVLQDLNPLLAQDDGILLGAYANTGRLVSDGSWEATGGQKSAVYAEYVSKWMDAGLRLVGGCCGTTPQHVSAIKEMF